MGISDVGHYIGAFISCLNYYFSVLYTIAHSVKLVIEYLRNLSYLLCGIIFNACCELFKI